MNKKLFKNRGEWRDWLASHHRTETEVWLVYYKKHTKKRSIDYNDAVEEALCYGWIDSIVKRIDDEKYMQKFTPRKEKSIWAATNKKRVEKLIREGKMAAPGLRTVEQAKADGSWNTLDKIDDHPEIPPELLRALEKRKSVKEKFDRLPLSHKKQYYWWIASAKRPETRRRRIEETIERIKADRKPGM